MTTGASSYRWRTPEQESARKSSSGYSIHCSLQNRGVGGWSCRSAVRSLRPMMAIYGLPRKTPKAPFFSLCCPPRVQHLPVRHDEINPKHGSRFRAVLHGKIEGNGRGPSNLPLHHRDSRSTTIGFIWPTVLLDVQNCPTDRRDRCEWKLTLPTHRRLFSSSTTTRLSEIR